VYNVPAQVLYVRLPNAITAMSVCRNGLVGRYYYPRWAIFLHIVVNQSVVPGQPLPPSSYTTSQLDAFAQRFCHETDHASYATNATGGARCLELSRQLLDEFNDASGVTLAKYTKHVGKDHPEATADLNLGHAIVSGSYLPANPC
jgi:hypothetical protein